MKEKNLKQINIHMDIHKALRVRAAEKNTTVVHLAEQAIIEFLSKDAVKQEVKNEQI